MISLNEQVKFMQNYANQASKMIRLDLQPGIHYEVEACDEGHNEPPAILATQIPGDNPAAKWCTSFTPFDFGVPVGKESSSEGAECGCFVKFKFTRPFMFRGYSFLIGDDCPERDPMHWKVIAKDSQANVTRLVDEHYHSEKHDASIMGDEPERLSEQRFIMRKMVFTDEVIFRFGATRYESDGLQISKIFFHT